MDQSGATTNGDGLTKHDRNRLLESGEQKSDQTDSQKDSNPWAKLVAASCTAGSSSSADGACKSEKLPPENLPTEKLPPVELVTYDPGAQKASTENSNQRSANEAAPRSGEAVLKRLAIASEPSNTLDAKAMPSGFQSVAQVSLRPDAIVDKAGKPVATEALVITPLAAAKPLVAAEPLVATAAAPVIQASDMVVKESTPGVKIEPATLVSKDPVAKEVAAKEVATKEVIAPPALIKVEATSTQSAFQVATQVSLKPEQVQPGSQATAQTLKIEPVQSGFQSVAQVSLRPDAIVEKSGKTITSEALVIAPISAVVAAPATLYTSQGNEQPQAAPADNSNSNAANPLAANRLAANLTVPVIRASDLVIKEATPGFIQETAIRTEPVVRIEPATKIEPAAKIEPVVLSAAPPTISSKDLIISPPPASSKGESGSQSAFQNVAQVSLRPDAIVDRSGATVAREALVIAPITAVTPNPVTTYSTQRYEQPQTVIADNSTAAAKLAPVPVIKASDLVIKEATPGGRQETANRTELVVRTEPAAKIEPAVLAAVPSTVASKDLIVSSSPTGVKAETGSQSGFQNVAQVSLRPDAIVDKSGATVAREALLIAPITAVTPNSISAYSTLKSDQPQAVVADNNSANAAKLAIPVIKASDLVIKEATPSARPETAIKVEPVVKSDPAAKNEPASLATSSTITSKDLVASSASTNAKAEAVTQSAFQNVAQVSLRPDGVVDKSGAPVIKASELVVKEVTQATKAESVTKAETKSESKPETIAKSDAVAKTETKTETVSKSDASATTAIGTKEIATLPGGKDAIVVGNGKGEAAPQKFLDSLQTAANSLGPKPLGLDNGQKQLDQPAAALSAALAAAINGRLIGQHSDGSGKTGSTASHGTASSIHVDGTIKQSAKDIVSVKTADTVKTGDVTGKINDITTKSGESSGKPGEAQLAGKQPNSIIQVGQGALTDTSSSTVKGNSIGTKTEIGSAETTTKSETTSSKGELSVNAELKLPLGKGKKSEEESDDDSATTKTAAKVLGGSGGSGSAGSQTVNGTGAAMTLVNGQPVDPTVAGIIGIGSGNGTAANTNALPPLEITDKENETGKPNRGNSNSNTNAGKKENGPSQKEISDALQAMIEKRRKERSKRPSKVDKKPEYKPEKQRRCLVLKGDTLDSLAEQYLADSDLAELIYEINKGFWREKRSNGMVYLEVIPGSTIFLPTAEEIAIFRRQKAISGKPLLSFKCSAPKAVRSLRQSLKQIQQEAEQEYTLALQLQTESEAQEDTVAVAPVANQEVTAAITPILPPTVFTAQAPALAPTAKTEERALALQFMSHLAQVADTSRVLVPNQAKQVRDLEESSRVAVQGSELEQSAYTARIEVLCDSVWQPVMEYVIGGRNDAILKIYSRCGKVREIDLDLPANIIREMAYNDLNTNRLNYCKKYLLGRKIFC